MSFGGLAPFADLAAWQIALMALIYGGAFFVKGVFGYGAVPILIVVGSFVVEAHQAVVLAAVSNLMTHVQYLPEGFRHGQRRLVGRLALFVMPAIVVGVWIFARIDGGNLAVVAGAVILGSILLDHFGLLDPLAPAVRRHERKVGPAFGTLSGLISGIVGAGAVAFISLYIRVFARDRQSFRATIILMTGVILVWRLSVLSVSGLVTLRILTEALLLLPFSLFAGLVGTRLSSRLGDADFFLWYRLTLGLGALLLIYRGISGGV